MVSGNPKATEWIRRWVSKTPSWWSSSYRRCSKGYTTQISIIIRLYVPYLYGDKHKFYYSLSFKGGSSNEDHNVRASSTDPSAAFKPQPSPRVVRSSLASWRSPTASSTTTSTTSGPHNGIMSGTSSVSSSNYHGIRTDRNASGPQPQKVLVN